MFSFDQPDEYERIVPRPQPVIIEETDVSKDGINIDSCKITKSHFCAPQGQIPLLTYKLVTLSQQLVLLTCMLHWTPQL